MLRDCAWLCAWVLSIVWLLIAACIGGFYLSVYSCGIILEFLGASHRPYELVPVGGVVGGATAMGVGYVVFCVAHARSSLRQRTP